jgi:hypothetical protein
MFDLCILKLIISNIKPHYDYGFLHTLVTKIIAINSRIRREQNRPPSSDLLYKYIVNCLHSSLTKTRVSSGNTTDAEDTPETT